MYFLKVCTLLCVIILSAHIGRAQEKGTISGQVITSDGRVAQGVTISLSGTKNTTASDNNGNYTIKVPTPGHYRIQVSTVGLLSQEKTVSLTAGQNSKVDFQLRENSNQLEVVLVSARTNGQQKRKDSPYIAKLPLKNIENPQVYNIISSELMKEQMVVSFDDAIKNAPGVNRLWSATGRAGDGAGYFSMRGFSVQPTIVNGIAGITNGGIDPANIERIEAIKGPSGTLYGSSLISFGGLINIVTKKPYDTFGGSVDYTIGGFGLSRIAADINTPLGKDTTVLFRLNTALHHEGSFQDAGFKKAIFIAPSLKYSPNERLTFIFNAEYLEPESTNPTMIFLNRSRQLIARTPSELKMDFDRSYTSNDISIKTPTFNISGQASYKLSDSWTSQTNISRGIRKSDGYYSYIMFLDASPSGPIAANDTLISRYLTYQNAIQTTTNIQQNFIGDFNIGKFRNRIVAGLDFIQSQSTNNSAPYIVFDYLNVTNPADPRYGNLSRSALDLRLAEAGGTTRSSTNNYVYGIYASDVFNITDRLLAMASLRYDYFDNKPSVNHKTGIESGKYAQGALSPKFGVVYELMKDQISVFANYMNGFRNVSPIANNELAGYPVNMKPQQANQKEVGVKIELPKQHLAVTASYYDISVDNQSRSITVDNPDPSGDPLNVTIQDGTQLSKGLEVDIIASPVNGLRIIGGFGYNDSKISKAAPATEGRRPTSAGPAYLANFWLSYTAPSGVLKGIGIGLGGNYASENLITSSLATGDFYLPEYTVLNSSLYYDAKQYRVGIKVDNLTDKEYFGGWSTIEKQLPRRVSANISFKF